MSKKSSKRTQLFDYYLNAFRQIYPKPTDEFLCVLCWKHWINRADAESGESVSLEHVPPDSVGGVELCLTCTRCNNTFGSVAESEVKKADKISQAFDGDTKSDGVYGKLDDVPAKFSWGKETGFLFEILSDHPPHKEQLENNVRLGRETKFTFGMYRPQLERVGRVKSAYLAMFAKFGFSYASDIRLDAIRYQLQAPRKNRVDVPVMGLPQSEHAANSIVIIQKPFSAALVTVSGVTVLLPWVFPDSLADSDLYKKLASTYSQGEKVKLTGNAVRWPSQPECLIDLHPDVDVSWPDGFPPTLSDSKA